MIYEKSNPIQFFALTIYLFCATNNVNAAQVGIHRSLSTPNLNTMAPRAIQTPSPLQPFVLQPPTPEAVASWRRIRLEDWALQLTIGLVPFVASEMYYSFKNWKNTDHKKKNLDVLCQNQQMLDGVYNLIQNNQQNIARLKVLGRDPETIQKMEDHQKLAVEQYEKVCLAHSNGIAQQAKNPVK